MAGFVESAASAQDRHRVERVTEQVSEDGAWDGADEIGFHVDRLAHSTHVLGW